MAKQKQLTDREQAIARAVMAGVDASALVGKSVPQIQAMTDAAAQEFAPEPLPAARKGMYIHPANAAYLGVAAGVVSSLFG
jgi:hypothetical protein